MQIVTTFLYYFCHVSPGQLSLVFFKPERNTEKRFSPMLASPVRLALPLRSTPEVNKKLFVIRIMIIQVNIGQVNSRGWAFLGVSEFKSRIILFVLIYGTMNHDEVYMPLCMNILFSYAVPLFNNVYEIFLGILPCAICFLNVSVCFNSVHFRRNIKIFHYVLIRFAQPNVNYFTLQFP